MPSLRSVVQHQEAMSVHVKQRRQRVETGIQYIETCLRNPCTDGTLQIVPRKIVECAHLIGMSVNPPTQDYQLAARLMRCTLGWTQHLTLKSAAHKLSETSMAQACLEARVLPELAAMVMRMVPRHAGGMIPEHCACCAPDAPAWSRDVCLDSASPHTRCTMKHALNVMLDQLMWVHCALWTWCNGVQTGAQPPSAPPSIAAHTREAGDTTHTLFTSVHQAPPRTKHAVRRQRASTQQQRQCSPHAGSTGVTPAPTTAAGQSPSLADILFSQVVEEWTVAGVSMNVRFLVSVYRVLQSQSNRQDSHILVWQMERRGRWRFFNLIRQPAERVPRSLQPAAVWAVFRLQTALLLTHTLQQHPQDASCIMDAFASAASLFVNDCVQDPSFSPTHQVHFMQCCVDTLHAAAWCWMHPLGAQARDTRSAVSAELLGTIRLLLQRLAPTHPHPLVPAVRPHAQRTIDACLRALVALTLTLTWVTLQPDEDAFAVAPYYPNLLLLLDDSSATLPPSARTTAATSNIDSSQGAGCSTHPEGLYPSRAATVHFILGHHVRHTTQRMMGGRPTGPDAPTVAQMWDVIHRVSTSQTHALNQLLASWRQGEAAHGVPSHSRGSTTGCSTASSGDLSKASDAVATVVAGWNMCEAACKLGRLDPGTLGQAGSWVVNHAPLLVTATNTLVARYLSLRGRERRAWRLALTHYRLVAAMSAACMALDHCYPAALDQMSVQGCVESEASTMYHPLLARALCQEQLALQEPSSAPNVPAGTPAVSPCTNQSPRFEAMHFHTARLECLVDVGAVTWQTLTGRMFMLPPQGCPYSAVMEAARAALKSSLLDLTVTPHTADSIRGAGLRVLAQMQLWLARVIDTAVWFSAGCAEEETLRNVMIDQFKVARGMVGLPLVCVAALRCWLTVCEGGEATVSEAQWPASLAWMGDQGAAIVAAVQQAQQEEPDTPGGGVGGGAGTASDPAAGALALVGLLQWALACGKAVPIGKSISASIQAMLQGVQAASQAQLKGPAGACEANAAAAAAAAAAVAAAAAAAAAADAAVPPGLSPQAVVMRVGRSHAHRGLMAWYQAHMDGMMQRLREVVGAG